MMPGSSFHSSSPLPSVGGDDVREVKKAYQYNPSRLCEGCEGVDYVEEGCVLINIEYFFCCCVCLYPFSTCYFLSFFVSLSTVHKFFRS